MDSYEILSKIRNETGLVSEQELPTRQLLAMINQAHVDVVNAAWKDIMVKKAHVATKSQSITVALNDSPVRCRELMKAYYGASARPCYTVAPEQEHLIGTNLNFAPTASYPKVVDFKSSLKFYPAPSTSTAVVINYYIDPAFMEYGIGTCSVTGTLIMDEFARSTDDYYNGEWLQLYTATAGVYHKSTRAKVTDYVASTKLLTLSEAITAGSYLYAFESRLPEHYHMDIVRGVLGSFGKKESGDEPSN